MCHFFNKRGYPAFVVQAGHHCKQQIGRQWALQMFQKEKNNRIPFTLTLNPHNHAEKSITTMQGRQVLSLLSAATCQRSLWI